NIIPVDYTVIDHNFIDDLNTSTIRYFKNGAVDTDGLLHGSSDLNKSATAYMLAGLSSLTKTQPANAEEIVQVTYDDVGLVGLEVYDENWAAVDNDDTPMDCNSSEHTYICGDLNVTFIPHHFNVENIHLRNHKDGNFTYLSNDLNMSMHIDVNLSARNAYDGITQNFQQGSLYYENPLSVDINVTEWNASIPVTTRHPLGNGTHKHDIPTETLLGFGGSDANGTHLIPWNESDTTQQLMFNYTRKNNQTVNPFILNGTDVNITVQSTYTDLTGLTPSSPVVIDGSGIADRNATLYFARVKSSQFFYDDVINSVQTPISVVVYCDTYPTCSELNNEVKINEPYWWLSVEHNEATGDGNITLISPPTVITGAGNPTITPDTDVTVIPAQPGVDTDVYVNSGATTSLPMSVEIFLDTTPSTDTNSWLIYNTASEFSDPDPFYKVRFIGAAGWAGHGDTGHVVDSNTSAKKNRRLGW
ncbi:MAG: hypothetical protein HKP62_06950, partial [Sulfurovum sp.]|nr:hypothetical protein [Sulfurovum sp.]NNJ45736.1 hypothetical protein [Sulfurovum sp.]